MPIDISSSVNNISNQVFGTSIINKYLGSTICVGILITFILLMIIMIFYPAKENTPIKIIFKVGLYSFLSSLLILFLHDGIIKSNLSNDKINENNEKIIQNLTNKNRDIIYNKNIPIKPNILGGDDEDEDGNYLGESGNQNNNQIVNNQNNSIYNNTFETYDQKPPITGGNRFKK
jgi:hypothetical protein